MQLVKDGPNIPTEVLQRLEDGKLVFFCGAGVSYPAGLPSFKGLVEQIYTKLHEEMEPEEEQAFKAGSYDRTLGLLENRLRESSLVRKAIIEILTIDPASKKLATHEAILTLAKFRDGDYRLVTTNFDRGFLLAGHSDLTVDLAPKLPVPKGYRWNSLVHLHGLMQDGDPEGRNLVVTTADFGAAYLTERWASRFVSELFRRYSVLFVGYSVEDPVIRYMVDALAADRRQGDEQAQKAYVLAPSDARGMEKEKRAWEAKSIEPILYNKRSRHVLLHRTLNAWAALHRDGLAGKERIVQRYGLIPPVRPYDEAVDQVLWALSEPSGHAARIFATLDPIPPSIEWLEVLDETGLLSRIDSSTELDNRIPLVDHGYRSVCPAPLDRVTRNLGAWLSRHLDKVPVLQWVINKGGCMHPDMRDLVREELRKNTLPAALATTWQFLSSEAYACACGGFSDWYDLLRIISNNPWNPVLKQQTLHFLRPRVRFGQPWRMRFDSEESYKEASEAERLRVRDLVEINIKLRAGDHVNTLVDDIKKLPNSEQILVDLVDGATTCLIEAWDLLAALEHADDKSDLSYIHQPSISEHEQNQGYEDWTKLLELVREAWRVASVESPGIAHATIERWREIRYPVFRRLALFGMAESDFYQPEVSLNYLLADDGWWLWSVETQRETFRLLSSISTRLDVESSNLLSNAILIGPPRKMFREELDDGKFTRIANHSAWLLLAKMREFGWTFTPEAQEQLATLSEQYPEWHLQLGDRDEFPTWMESGWGYETEFSVDQLRSMDVAELGQTLLETQQNREGLLDLWREVARKDPDKAIQVLKSLGEEAHWVEDIWHSALNGFGGEKIYLKSWHDLSPDLVGAPDGFYAVATRPLSWWLRDVTKSLKVEEEGSYWLLWDRLICIAGEQALENMDDPVSKAINAPAGLLTESLLDRIWARKPIAGEGFDETIKKRITQLTKGEESGYMLCRVILASRLQVLFAIDQEWCRSNLLQYFDWEKSREARQVWEGYLWTPRINPDLLAAIKKDMLRALAQKDQLGDHARQLCQLFMISSLEFPDGFTHKEIREAVRNTDSKGRAELADTLRRRVAEAGKESASFWANRAEPWIDSLWPKDRALMDTSTSKAFALASIAAGNAFERAVKTILKYVVRVNDPSLVVHQLESAKINEEPIAIVYPKSVLQLLDSIIADDAKWPSQEWRAVLDQIAQADTSLRDSVSYRRLDEFLRRHGL